MVDAAVARVRRRSFAAGLGAALVALLAAGCGRTYSDAQVRAALAPDAPGGSRLVLLRLAGATAPRPFATWDAVTDLRLDPPQLLRPVDALAGGGVVALRYAGTHDAWESAPALALDHPGGVLAVRRRGNVVLVGRSRAAVDAAAARLP